MIMIMLIIVFLVVLLVLLVLLIIIIMIIAIIVLMIIIVLMVFLIPGKLFAFLWTPKCFHSFTLLLKHLVSVLPVRYKRLKFEFFREILLMLLCLERRAFASVVHPLSFKIITQVKPLSLVCIREHLVSFRNPLKSFLGTAFFIWMHRKRARPVSPPELIFVEVEWDSKHGIVVPMQREGKHRFLDLLFDCCSVVMVVVVVLRGVSGSNGCFLTDMTAIERLTLLGTLYIATVLPALKFVLPIVC